MSKKKDVTGRSRMARNLVGRWLGQIVVIITGFVIPRLIGDNLGAVSLGIWDFGWSTVSYFRYMGFGMAAGLNRFVALYTAKENVTKLRRAVSSTVFLQMVIGACVAAASFGVASLVPVLFDEIEPAQVRDAQLVLIFLGCNLAVRMAFWPSRGILTGNHLWTVTAGVTAFGDTVLLIAMFAVLIYGGTLAHLGMVVFGTAIMTESIRDIMAKRVYPYPKNSWQSVDKKTMIKMFIFGFKNSIAGMSRVIVLQTTALCLAAAAGPAALAVYARPVALFSHADKFISLYAFLLTPVAGSLQGLKRDAELRELRLSSLQASFAMTIPAVFLLSGYGDAVVRLWMGDGYVVPLLAPRLGLAFLLPYAHAVSMRILVGIDAHGRVAVRSLLYSCVMLAISIGAAFWYGWSPIVAAIVVCVSLAAGPGMSVVVAASRRLGVGFGDYLRDGVSRPLLCNLPLAAVIVVSRYLDKDVTTLDAVIWGGIGGTMTVILYWFFVMPDSLRAKLRRRVGMGARA